MITRLARGVERRGDRPICMYVSTPLPQWGATRQGNGRSRCVATPDHTQRAKGLARVLRWSMVLRMRARRVSQLAWSVTTRLVSGHAKRMSIRRTKRMNTRMSSLNVSGAVRCVCRGRSWGQQMRADQRLVRAMSRQAASGDENGRWARTGMGEPTRRGRQGAMHIERWEATALSRRNARGDASGDGWVRLQRKGTGCASQVT